ncbi:5527_t:CDS:2 [Dentiscutata erythropus]|uniref:5527_t:CDS:1 n=1 Tax=Dentiscutata erythropus TaxID=1348616 RepID=A0A9N8W0Y5_9GLOM|nr:5527_t:CDS:2 [Dentiscutata erythropus]
MYVRLNTQEFEIPEELSRNSRLDRRSRRIEYYQIKPDIKEAIAKARSLNFLTLRNNNLGSPMQSLPEKKLMNLDRWYYDGEFDFGVVVGVLYERISDKAYNSAENSEHDIIVTLMIMQRIKHIYKLYINK